MKAKEDFYVFIIGRKEHEYYLPIVVKQTAYRNLMVLQYKEKFWECALRIMHTLKFDCGWVEVHKENKEEMIKAYNSDVYEKSKVVKHWLVKPSMLNKMELREVKALFEEEIKDG